jgi:uncharacterized protein (TIGR02284 family)
MTTSDKRVIKWLNRLYRICEAGERGFETVAENISNRGLKVLVKTLAQHRAQFKAELQTEIERVGGKLTERLSFRGIVHRGRMDILATLIIGPENVEKFVLKEAALGEKVALNEYSKALKQEMLPETKAIVERQYQQIQVVNEQIAHLRGHSGKQLVVRLFDSDQDKETAVRALQAAGYDLDMIETIPLNERMDVYQGEGTTISDTIVSGAVGGAIWGSILGAAAGISFLFMPGLGTFWDTTFAGTWGIVALAGTIAGAFFGSILGFFIGVGVSGEDSFLYGDSVAHGNILVMMRTEAKRATEASQIMYQVNAESRDRQRIAVPEYK